MKKAPFRPDGFMPRLLVVDDDPSALALVDKILRSDSCLVTCVASAELALKQLNQTSGFDVLLVDAMMPEMDGYQLVRSIRADARFTDLPVLMMTRKLQREDFKLALNSGVTDYVIKPLDAALLKEKVRSLVGKRPS